MTRLRECRERAGMSQKFVALSLGVKPPSVSNWESGKTNPSQENLQQLADLYGVTTDYLLGRSDGAKVQQAIPAATIYPAGDFSAVRILGSVRCGAGGLALMEFDGYEFADVRNPEEYFWLRVTGDSMEPDIREGQLALVHIQSDVESSELAVVVVDGEEGMLKKVIKRDGAVILQSFNPRVEPRIFTGESLNRLRIVGKVVETKQKW